jgi:hypothetical protein
LLLGCDLDWVAHHPALAVTMASDRDGEGNRQWVIIGYAGSSTTHPYTKPARYQRENPGNGICLVDTPAIG